MKDVDFAAGEKEMAKFEAIVRSMTRQERRHPEVLNGSRRKRIAAGAGVTVQQVNQTVANFEKMRQLMKGLASGNMPGMGRMAPMAQHGIAKRKKKGGGGNNSGSRFRLPFGRN
jgi:signal recognition particle subunit SRP54